MATIKCDCSYGRIWMSLPVANCSSHRLSFAMCGRYRLSRHKQIIADHFDATPFHDDLARATTLLGAQWPTHVETLRASVLHFTAL